MSLSHKSIRSVRLPWVDFLLFLVLVSVIYALVGVAAEWTSPYRPTTEISLSVGALFKYSILSLSRVVAGYLLSLLFTFSYGYAAAKSKVAEPFLISLLDILQSVPVLGFMPGLVLALVHLFPNSNVGLELATVLMIFTGQGWNMVFSYYTSLKNVPREFREVGSLFRMSRWEYLRQVEIPYATNGLLWNSMLSMAGGWFFLMVIESFQLGSHDFRLPGIGSYMAVAFEVGDHKAVWMGVAAMFSMIILVDRCLWAPLVVWSERFKAEGGHRGAYVPTSLVLEWLQRSEILNSYFEYRDIVAGGVLRWWGKRKKWRMDVLSSKWILWSVRIFPLLRLVLVGVVLSVLILGGMGLWRVLGESASVDWLALVGDTLFTMLRVLGAVILGSLWAIPVGVWIGSHPKWSLRLRPVVQVVASFPAPMLFPVITGFLIWTGIPLGVGAVVLMLFASQWYILFNVISGSSRIPDDLTEMATSFGIRGLPYWKSIVLPSIFPDLVNGWITAAGGAWNACIIAEFVAIKGGVLVTSGIGATITQAALDASFGRLAAAILVMVTTVVLLNRLFWDNLYKLAESKYRIQ